MPLQVPEAPQAQHAGGGKDHAGQKQGELEAPEERRNRRVERVMPDGRGDPVDLAARDVGAELRRRLPFGRRQRSSAPVAVGQDRTAGDGAQDCQPIAVPTWRQELNRAEPIPDDPAGTWAMAAAEPAGTIRPKPTPTKM